MTATAADRLTTDVTESFDWWTVAERLADLVGEPLRASSVAVGALERE